MYTCDTQYSRVNAQKVGGRGTHHFLYRLLKHF